MTLIVWLKLWLLAKNYSEIDQDKKCLIILTVGIILKIMTNYQNGLQMMKRGIILNMLQLQNRNFNKKNKGYKQSMQGLQRKFWKQK